MSSGENRRLDHGGEAIGAVREVAMNRKQMLYFLPSLLAGMGSTARGAIHRTRAGLSPLRSWP